MSSDHVSLWDRCLTIIKDNVPEAIYTNWFAPIVPYSFENNVLIIQVPTHFFYEYLELNFRKILQLALFRVFGKGIQLKYKIMMVSDPKTEVDIETVTKPVSVEVKKTAPAVQIPDPFKRHVYEELDSQLNPNYNFDNYCQSPSNQLARTAGMTIADKPGKNAFNPFFLLSLLTLFTISNAAL